MDKSSAERTAIVLFNLGGPDQQSAVRPFLFNLFNDPAIITLPGPLRYLIAQLISRRRAPVAAEIYQAIGGGSPLLPNTVAQAQALDAALDDLGEVKSFIAMRYWHPFADETAREVAAFKPTRILLLPLYPQYSATTTGSSLKDWDRAAAKIGLSVPTTRLCCYPGETGFVEAVTDLTSKTLDHAVTLGAPRLLFSAHGLPKKFVDGGDPYQWQVERTVAGIVQRLAIRNLDWSLCYQSRVGPLEWIGPSTDEEVLKAAADRRVVVICPVAFVSEHSETLVELDIEYRHLAMKNGAAGFARVPAVGTHPSYIEGLAHMVRRGIGRTIPTPLPDTGSRLCPSTCGRCPVAEAA